MFTGLIEEMGHITSRTVSEESLILEISAEKVLTDVRFGDSICINGVCLSVMTYTDQAFRVGLAPETRRLTTLESLAPGDRVNLERAVLPTTRLGGHYVQGHVDGTGIVKAITDEGDAKLIRIGCSADMMRYIVRKGYIAVDGTSLTVVDAGPEEFSLTLISHSQPLVVLGQATVGDRVNLEVDIMAKYAEKLLYARRIA
ncbi:MAG: riboflavin synthase [Parvularcula sp.]